MEKNQDLKDRREATRLGGGANRIERQHAQGKLTAHERVTALLDEGSFNEVGQFVEHRSISFGLEKTTTTCSTERSFCFYKVLKKLEFGLCSH